MGPARFGKRWLPVCLLIAIVLFLTGHLTAALVAFLLVLAANAYINSVNEKGLR